MATLDMTTCRTSPLQVCTTMWHCSRCNAFLSIHSLRVPDDIHCPACGEVLLDFCGRLSSIPWIQFGDA
jgi:DNA-directed RNA polymerase subunit RPC12/RpoP